MPKQIKTYKELKIELKAVADEVKLNCPTDIPMINMAINDEVDYLSKTYQLSDKLIDMLGHYACKLHAKKISFK